MAPKKQKNKANEIILPHGIDVDLDEAWKKLIANQFPGSPGRGFGELIQNFLDSYPASTPWQERRGEIESGQSWIRITDYGEGMDRNRLALLVTLGGTDKNLDKDKIGTFGVGFFSIFNPKLGTRRVRLVTRCEGQGVEMIFKVKKPGQRPVITTRVLKKKVSFSTRIEVLFTDPDSVRLCLDHAQLCLKYYPCRVTVDGEPYQSIWQQAEQEGAILFDEGNCHGFLEHQRMYFYNITLLCKYEFLMDTHIVNLFSGGGRIKGDLRDYRLGEMPYLEGWHYTVNCNDLNVTISRDSFSMDHAYMEMMRSLARVMTRQLGKKIQESYSVDLVLANQYTLINKLCMYRRNRDLLQKNQPDIFAVINLLFNAKVYRLNGKKGYFSLNDLFEMKSDDLPLFFSPLQSNLHWLGGQFKHDFIVLPPECTVGSGAPNMFDIIFGSLFDSVVNLDTIAGDEQRVDELIEAGVVDRDSLHPVIEFKGERKLTDRERIFLAELSQFFTLPEVRKAITKNLCLPVREIKPLFFDIKGDDAVVATGLFDDEGKVLAESAYCNLNIENTDGSGNRHSREIVLGLHRDHNLIRSMIDNNDPDRFYFALPILAHELALCQKQLVPYSVGYHLVKEQLATDMRKALMGQLLVEKAA